jgi:CheY-like chemotaxis protein
VLAASAPAAARRRIALHASITEGALPVMGDRGRLEQALQQLLANALKFTPAGGRVSVSVRRDERDVTVAVEDTGDGIAPEFLPRVFDAFSQADASPTRRHGGLGVGLAITKAIVRQHGGELTADSPGSGRGARFAVTLPLVHEAPLDWPNDASDRVLSGYSVMVVDDDADTCDLLRCLLESFGARVAAFHSVPHALEGWDSARPHVLVSDIGMPEQDGYSLIRAVRSKPAAAGGAIPAVALTAFGCTRDRELALAAGFQVHLRKPVDPLRLVETIAGLTRGT